MRPSEHTGLTEAEVRVLTTLDEHYEPFKRLEQRGYLFGHPYEITIAGRAALAAARKE